MDGGPTRPAAAAATPPLRTRGIRGDLTELPEPTISARVLAARMMDALRERNMTHRDLCRILKFNDAYFSFWINAKPMSERSRRLVSAACELWLEDPSFCILDPALTRPSMKTHGT
eukprot:6516327-Prymnesium_polylepis.1